jgi:hypothetical protein
MTRSRLRYTVPLLAGAAGIAITAAPVRADLVELNLTAAHSQGSFGGALFETVDFRSAGTGIINSFVRIQRAGVQQGYNTSGRPTAFDENTSGNFTRNLTFGEIPTRSIDGTDYKEFMLDINQTSANSHISLDQVKIYTSLVGSQTTSTIDNLGNLVYEMDTVTDNNWVHLDYALNAGSGQGDMRMLVPVSAFGNITSETFIYLYSLFGDNYVANDGFEEWAVQTDNIVVPLPSANAMGICGLAGVGVLSAWKRRRA